MTIGAVVCRAALISVAASVSAALTPAYAQLIAVKTAPVADGGQFAFLPSTNLGMGGVSLALADPALDAFVNPALGTRSHGVRLFGSPTFFSLTRQSGGGFTFPLGASTSSKAWFTQVTLATQDVDAPSTLSFGIPVVASPLSDVLPGTPVPTGRVSRVNRFAHGLVGRRFPGDVSIAASASWWSIHAIDGVEMYYRDSDRIDQRGDALDLRLGMVKDWRDGRSFEALVVRNDVDIGQDVTFHETFWDPSRRQMIPVARIEPNAQRAETWGLHLAIKQPLADTSWRVGGILTANRIRQPSLPRYDLPVIPADDGRANAFNIGGGVSRTSGTWTAGIDAILEPIWSRTWVRADAATETRTGAPVAAGATTLENNFRFINSIARAGVAATAPLTPTRSLTFEVGGQLRAIQYRLEQTDAVRESRDRSTQRWNEWTRTWGLKFRFAGGDIRYNGHLTTGAGRPGFDDDGSGVIIVDRAPPPRPGFGGLSTSIPSFGLTFANVRATTHQLSFSIPIR